MFARKHYLVLLLVSLTGCASGRNHKDFSHYQPRWRSSEPSVGYGHQHPGENHCPDGSRGPAEELRKERIEMLEEAFVSALEDSVAESIVSRRLDREKAHDSNDVREAQLYALSARLLIEGFWSALKEMSETRK